jgi:hypothetical protein
MAAITILECGEIEKVYITWEKSIDDDERYDVFVNLTGSWSRIVSSTSNLTYTYACLSQANYQFRVDTVNKTKKVGVARSRVVLVGKERVQKFILDSFYLQNS